MSTRSILSRSARPLATAALALAVAGALAVPQQARASAFQLKENSAKALGRAFAGSASAGGDAAVVVNNPAAMTLLKGTTFQADVTAINFQAKFSGSAYDAFGRPISGDNGGDAGTTLPVPAFYLVTDLDNGWHVGFAFNAPFGFKTQYDRGWKGRYNAIKTDLKSLDATLSASYDLSDTFTLGASVIAQRTSAKLTSAINFNTVGLGVVQQAAMAGAITPADAQMLSAQVNALIPPGTDGYSRISGDDWAYGWEVGALWKITPQDNLGFSYRSKIKHTLTGTADFQTPAAVQAVLSSPQVAPLLGGAVPFTNTSGTADLTTPAVAMLSYWHHGSRFGYGADFAWTKWDSFKQLRVDYANPAQPPTVERFNWRNSKFMSVGGEYYASSKLTVRYGVALDTTPTYAATRDPRVPDGTRRWITFGLGYQATPNMDLNLGLAHVFVSNAHINNLSPTNDRLVGVYKDSGNVMSLSMAYRF